MSDAQQTIDVTDADVTSLKAKLDAFRASLTPAEAGALQAIWSKGAGEQGEVSGYDFSTFDPSFGLNPSSLTYNYLTTGADLSRIGNIR